MIKLLVFDVDGTLSDGKVYYSQSGEEIKSFSTRDGLAISVWNRQMRRALTLNPRILTPSTKGVL